MAETYSTSPQNGIWPNLTGSKCSMSSTSNLCFSDQSKNNDDVPPLSLHDWLRDFQLLLFNRLRIGIWQNLIFMKQVFKLCLLPSFWVFFFFFCFFRGGGGWPEYAENKYAVRVVNFISLWHVVLVIIPQLGGSLQGFALFHIISYIETWFAYFQIRILRDRNYDVLYLHWRSLIIIIIIIIILLYLKRVTHLAYNNYSSMWPSKDSFTIVHVDRYTQAMQWIIIYNKHRNTKESQYIEIYTCIPEHSSI